MSGSTGPAPPRASQNALRVRFDTFELDEANASLLRDGKAVPLPPTPFSVLCALARRPGALLTKNDLLDEVWGHRFVSESVLKTAISELRTALQDDARQPRFIETVSRRGYRFIAAVAAESAARPGPETPPEGRTQSFIGRAEALARLEGAWRRACNGRRTVVWVAGEPGIGKTTLIEHFVSGLGEVACARGQCVEQYGAGEPYLPVLEALAELCRKDSTVAPLLRAAAPTWLLQLPWLSTVEERDALRRELVGVSPDRMLREISEVLDRYTERRPLLLVTEDLHWSDRATIQLMDCIARRRGSGRLMWLASFRLAEVVVLDHPLSSLRHELRVHGLCEEIVLDPFSESEVAEYLAQRSPALAADEAFVRALHERTDGVPLFVAHVLKDIISHAPGSGHEAPDDKGRLESMAVPENLAAIIDHYIAKLPGDQRALLSAAAVCGVEFRVSTASNAIERDAASVGRTCGELAREQFWLVAPRAGEGGDGPDAPYAFRHALFRQVLYERMAPSVRAQLHRKVGAALEGERAAGGPVTPAQLAMHFERGGDPATALRYYAEAAEAALGRFSPDECMSLTESALALLGQAPPGTGRKTQEIALRALHGFAAIGRLGVREAKGALQRAYLLLDEVPQHPMRGRLLHGLGFALILRAEYAEALAVADRAEALASAANDPVLLASACTVHGEVDHLQGRPAVARAWLERGLALAEPLDLAPEEFLSDPQVTLLAWLSIPLLHLGLVEQARGCLQRATARARDGRWPMARLVAKWQSALFEVRLGNAERVAALADEMRELGEEHGLAHGRNGWRWFRGWADARMGEPIEGHRRIREAYENNTGLGMLAGASETLGYAAEALLLAGDYDAAKRELEEALRIASAHGERVYLSQLYLIEAAIARARGQSAEALASVRRAVGEARTQQAPWLELNALIELGEGGGATADDRRALAGLVDQLPEVIATTAFKRARVLLGKTT